MTETAYVQKKLKPLRDEEQRLQKDLKKVTEELTREEENNGKFFEELQQLERTIEQKAKEVQNLQNEVLKIQNVQQGGADMSNSDLETRLEDKVKAQLNVFLLKYSRKDRIGEKIEWEMRTKNKENFEQKDDDDLEERYRQDDINYAVYVKKEDEHASKVPIDPEIRQFEGFRTKMGLYFGVNEKQVFLADRLGNLLMFHLNILDSLYPPVYTLLKKYEPLIHIIIKKPIVEKVDQRNQNIIPQSKALPPPKSFNRTRRPKKKEDDYGEPVWEKVKRYMSRVKYFLENILFLVMVVMFAVNNFDSTEFQERQSLYSSVMSNFPINPNYEFPEKSLIEMVEMTIPSDVQIQDNQTLFPTLPMKVGLIVQQLAMERPLNDCLIVQPVQLQQLQSKNHTCLDYDTKDTKDLGTADHYQYNTQYQGYIWKFPTTSQEELKDSWESLIEEGWLQYRRSFSTITVNFYNAPSNKLAVFTASSLVIQPEGALNFNSVDVQVLPLTPLTPQQQIVAQSLFLISILLFLFALVDIFGVYTPTTQEKLILLHRKIQHEEKIRQQLIDKRKRNNIKINPEDEKPITDTSGLLDDFIILEIRMWYLVIKKPTVYEYICIIIIQFLVIFSLILVSAHAQVQTIYEAALHTVDLQTNDYFDASSLIATHQTVTILSAVNILLIMMSAARFMGNWNTYLYAYGQTMVSFTKYTWFLILVLGFMFSMLAIAWIINIQGQLLYHFNFTYVILGLIRTTLNYGIYNNVEQIQPFRNLRNSIVYSFENQYVSSLTYNQISYICIMCITFTMFPIFSAMLTKFVHDTKEELNMKLASLQSSKKEEAPPNIDAPPPPPKDNQ